MHLDAAAEHAAARLFAIAGLDPRDVPGAPAVAVEIFGAGCLEFLPARRAREEAALATVCGRPRIFVRDDLFDARLNYVVARELGAWWAARTRQDVDTRRVAAALVCPAEPFAEAVHARRSVRAMASDFCAPESLVGLRVAAADGTEAALVAPEYVRRVGPRERLPASDDEVRRLAVAVDILPAQLRRLRCAGEPRVVLSAA